MSPLRRRCLILTNVMSVSLGLAFGSSKSLAQPETAILSVGNNTVTFAPPTAADYAAGFETAAQNIPFTVAPGNGAKQRTAIVNIRAISATMTGGSGTKPIGDVQWRRTDLATWNPLTVTSVFVQSGQLGNHTGQFSNVILFRILLSWGADTPATYLANIEVTLTQTVP